MNTSGRITPAAWAAAAVLILVHIGLVWTLRAPAILTGHDDAQYVLLARTLQDFGYNDVFRTDAAAHRMYPPGYPAALALWGLFTSNDFDSLLLVTIASSAASLVLFFVVVARLWSSAIALLSVGVLALNPYIVDNGGTIASEAPYMFLSMAAVWFSELVAPGAPRRNTALSILVAIAAALTRAVGVTVLFALGLTWLFRRQWRPLAILGGLSLVTVVAWLAWAAATPEQFVGRSYLADAIGEDLSPSFMQESPFTRTLRNVSLRTWTNTRQYLTSHLPNRLVVPTIPDTPVDNGVSLLILVISLTVGFAGVYRRWFSLAIYLACYAGILLIWNWPLGRFLDPVLPFIVLTILLGAKAVASRFNLRWGWPAALAIAAILAGSGGIATAQLVRTRVSCQGDSPANFQNCLSPQQRAFFAALDYTREKLPHDAIFFTGKPATLYYYTGRTSVSRDVAESQDPDTFARYLRDSGVDFLLIGDLHSIEERVSYLMEADCGAYAVEAIFPGTYYLFRVLDENAHVTDMRACSVIEDYHRSIAERENRPLHPERVEGQATPGTASGEQR